MYLKKRKPEKKELLFLDGISYGGLFAVSKVIYIYI